MKIIRCFAISIAFAAIFSFQISAQTIAPAKIAIINSQAFLDEKTGITKYINAFKQLSTEFGPAQKELETMNARLDALSKEINALREQAASGKVPVDMAAAQRKVEQASQLERDIKFKSEDGKYRFERRQQDLIGPVMRDVGGALVDFAKLKGYGLIFDISKDNTGFLVVIGDDKLDATKDFIAWFNARPATTPTTPTKTKP